MNEGEIYENCTGIKNNCLRSRFQTMCVKNEIIPLITLQLQVLPKSKGQHANSLEKQHQQQSRVLLHKSLFTVHENIFSILSFKRMVTCAIRSKYNQLYTVHIRSFFR